MMSLELNTLKKIQLKKLKQQWISTSTDFPEFLAPFSATIKAENEDYMQSASATIQKQIKRYPRIPFCRNGWKNKTYDMMNTVLANEPVLGIHQVMSEKSINHFQEELKIFLCQVRTFAPELGFPEIGQALRNYIVYVMFKEMTKTTSGFSMAAFGYSMLYPFTDNFIDSTDTSEDEKQKYNQIIQDKLEGKAIHPTSLHQHKTCELLQAIESEYPRDGDTTIFQLLLMMLDAQRESLRQQNESSSLTIEELLDISLYKGSLSVLIDRFLVKKELTENDLHFYLGFGFFLQLVDDLQDIKKDSLEKYQTIFTCNLQHKQSEMQVNKLLHFLHQIMMDYQAENSIFRDFILSNCNQLIFASVNGSKDFFSQEYLDKIEPFLPVTYPFLEHLKMSRVGNDMLETQSKNMRKLDALIFEL